MRLVLMHLHNEPAELADGEEATLIVPGSAEKVAIAVPLLAVPEALAIVVEAVAGVRQICSCCGGDLAALPHGDAVVR